MGLWTERDKDINLKLHLKLLELKQNVRCRIIYKYTYKRLVHRGDLML